MTTHGCMGGWCAVRERCKHYHAQSYYPPIERMCEPKTHSAYEPVARVIPIKEDEPA